MGWTESSVTNHYWISKYRILVWFELCDSALRFEADTNFRCALLCYRVMIGWRHRILEITCSWRISFLCAGSWESVCDVNCHIPLGSVPKKRLCRDPASAECDQGTYTHVRGISTRLSMTLKTIISHMTAKPSAKPAIFASVSFRQFAWFLTIWETVDISQDWCSYLHSGLYEFLRGVYRWMSSNNTV